MRGLISAFIDSRLRAFTNRYHYDLGYARNILNTGLRPFAVFSSLFMLANHRQSVPISPWLTAKWIAVKHEDCGPCQQLVIDMGLEQGMSSSLWDAIIQGDLARMTPDVGLVYHWAHGILTPAQDIDQLAEWRRQITDRWGERGVISLALAMAGGRSFPLMKRAMGQHHVCQILRTDAPRTGAAASHQAGTQA